MTATPRSEQILRFECRQPSDRNPLYDFVSLTLGSLTGLLLSALLNDRPFDTTVAVGIVAAMAIFELALFAASRSRTTITIRNSVVTIQTGSLVYGSFALTDIAHFEPSVTLKDSIRPGPVEVSTVTTKSGAIFHVPTGNLAPKDKNQFIELLSPHAQPH